MVGVVAAVRRQVERDGQPLLTYEDDGPEWDFDVDASMVEESMAAWTRERAAADEAIAAHRSPDDTSGANGRSLRWNLLKLVGEYARHNGHADLLRERVDGVTGE